MLRHRLPELVPPPTELPPQAAALPVEVRAFLEEERAAQLWLPRAGAWLSGWDERFTRELGRIRLTSGHEMRPMD
jgi:acyl-CoA dehydrogenase